MKIEFFGDSFSADKYLIQYRYKTYIQLLEKEYNTSIKINSIGGTSHWNVIIKQFLPRINSLPDICIFTWPDENRLFHRKVTGIRRTVALDYSPEKFNFLQPTYNFGRYRDQWNAAKMYYRYLFDEEKNELEYMSSLFYFDNAILEKIKNTKFIHLWSFEKKHSWNNSIELSEPLIKIAEQFIDDYHQEKNYLAPNHLPTQELNDYIFEKVKGLVDEVSG